MPVDFQISDFLTRRVRVFKDVSLPERGALERIPVQRDPAGRAHAAPTGELRGQDAVPVSRRGKAASITACLRNALRHGPVGLDCLTVVRLILEYQHIADAKGGILFQQQGRYV